MKALQFEGRGSEYFKIWIVNILLTIVTLSLYYPWAKVRTRRYFLGNTTLEGREFDYHATGKQLLPGYLITLVLVLIYVVSQNVFPIIGLILTLVLLLAFPWIIWRSLKFNMRMTSFSTVRFGFDGTAGRAYVNYLFWPSLFLLFLALGQAAAVALTSSELLQGWIAGVLAAAVSLAGFVLAFLLYAFVKKRQTQYKINGYCYGQGQFRTAVTTSGFAKILLKSILFALLILIVIFASVTAVALLSGFAAGLRPLADKLGDPEALKSAMSGGMFAVFAVVYICFLLGIFFIAAYAYTRQRAYILNNSTLDNQITFASTLRATRLVWVLITNFLLVIFTLGLGTPWARTRMARLLTQSTLVDTGAGLDRYVTEKQSEQSSLGEQLGDGFDVDVDVGF